VNLPVDPKKLAPDLLDSHHHEENPAGVGLLVELVTAAGRRPDEVAWELQIRDLPSELALLAPMLFIMLLSSFGLRGESGLLLVYVFGLWPALAYRLLWAPLRGRRATNTQGIVHDLVFVAASFLQSLFFAIPATLALGAGTIWVLHFFWIGNNIGPIFALALGWFILLPHFLSKGLALNLVEREMEEVTAALPPGSLEETESSLGAVSLWACRLRTLFRASMIALIGYLPHLFLLEILDWRYRHIPSFTWIFPVAMGGLALHHLVRGFFYTAMADRTRTLLKKREASMAEASLLLPEPKTSSLGRGEDLTPVTSPPQTQPNPRDLAWREMRHPLSLLASLGTGILGITLLFGLVAGLKALGTPTLWALVPLVALLTPTWGVAQVGTDRSTNISPGSRLLTALPISLFTLAVLAAFSWAATPIFRFFDGGPVATTLAITLSLLAMELGARVWAWSIARVLPGKKRIPVFSCTQDTLDATGETWRRGLILSAGTWGLGILFLAFLERMGLQLWRPSFGWVTAMAIVGFPSAMGVQVLLKSYLAEALELEGEPPKKPAMALPPGD
jgi:hypothetical protein